MHAKSPQLYPTLCDPIDAGSSVHRVLTVFVFYSWTTVSCLFYHLYPHSPVYLLPLDYDKVRPIHENTSLRRRQWQFPVLLPGKSHGWRSLVGCSPRGRTELDTTEATYQQCPSKPFFFSFLLFGRAIQCMGS